MVFSSPPASNEHHEAESCRGEEPDFREFSLTPVRAMAADTVGTGDCRVPCGLEAIGEVCRFAAEGGTTSATTLGQGLDPESTAEVDGWVDAAGGMEWAMRWMEDHAPSMGPGAAQQQSLASPAGSCMGLDGAVVEAGGPDVMNDVDNTDGYGSVAAESVTDYANACCFGGSEATRLLQEEKGIASPDWLDVTHAMLHKTSRSS